MTKIHFLLLMFTLIIALPGTSHGGAKKIFNLCRVVHPSDSDIDWDCQRIKRGDTAEKLFGDRWQDVLRFNRTDRRHLYAGVSLKVPRNLEDIADFTPLPAEYPETAGEEKFILVDLSEQFVGAYEYGALVFSTPIASGDKKNKTPTGDFRVTAFSRHHASSLYKIEKTDTPYPMNYGLRFFINSKDVAFWLHGRDVPGYPASHGCVGMYDEEMQHKHYKSPSTPLLQDARALYEWVIGTRPDSGDFTLLKNGPRVRVISTLPPQLRRKFSPAANRLDCLSPNDCSPLQQETDPGLLWPDCSGNSQLYPDRTGCRNSEPTPPPPRR